MTAGGPVISYLTAGGAGMFCGSCLHDNTLAAALVRRGVDVVLTPLYTPIRTDEPDVSTGAVYFGGINVYLQQKLALFRGLPRWVDRWLDRPWLIRLATGRGVKTTARDLGDMTLSMLQGDRGRQRKEVQRLVDHLDRDVRPDLVVLTNMLVAGMAPALRRRRPGAPIVVTLQGDDLFLDDLPEPWRGECLAEIRRLDEHVAGYLAQSRFYAEAMARKLGLPREKFRIVPLGIQTSDFEAAGPRPQRAAGPAVLGYFARLCPAKGLDRFVDAAIELAGRPGLERMLVRVAGWLPESDREFVEGQFSRLRAAGVAFEHAGVLEREAKLQFLRSIDVLCVPTAYEEPKGLFALEGLAAGAVVVMPNHGAFPELLTGTPGAYLAPPGDSRGTADVLEPLLRDLARCEREGAAGREATIRTRSAEAMAAGTEPVLRSFLTNCR